jgi:hypothetical protein
METVDNVDNIVIEVRKVDEVPKSKWTGQVNSEVQRKLDTILHQISPGEILELDFGIDKLSAKERARKLGSWSSRLAVACQRINKTHGKELKKFQRTPLFYVQRIS